ncbi:MAG: winged helix-turn-helix domain-containing protein [Candidatus Aenigmatarchaeota archaeon]|nr:winged helix-turn-helix domain-containing protein [Candidatus Aenigmarchaeota archaeon]
MIKFLGQEKARQTEDDLNKQLNIQHAQLFKVIEDMRELNQKIERIFVELEQIKQKLDKTPMSDNGFESQAQLKKDKTKEAIKIILRKKGRMTSEDLSKLIGLSRSRCNEYLKEMERNKEARSEIENRKKYYRLV